MNWELILFLLLSVIISIIGALAINARSLDIFKSHFRVSFRRSITSDKVVSQVSRQFKEELPNKPTSSPSISLVNEKEILDVLKQVRGLTAVLVAANRRGHKVEELRSGESDSNVAISHLNQRVSEIIDKITVMDAKVENAATKIVQVNAFLTEHGYIKGQSTSDYSRENVSEWIMP